MTQAERNELRELAEEATPEPWRVRETPGKSDVVVEGPNQRTKGPGSHRPFVIVARVGSSGAWEDRWRRYHRDARFIALSREAVPRLLDEIERLEREAANRTTGCPSCACQGCHEKYGRDRDA